MWRIVCTTVLVLIVDCALLFIAVMGPLEVNMHQISRALAAQTEHPSPENKRTLDAEKKKAASIQFATLAATGVAVFLITAGGFFIAGRQFERSRHTL